MANATIDASIRTETGKGVARKLRQQGLVPANIYGHGREPQSLVLNAREFDKILSTFAIATTVVEVGVDGRTARTLIREVQRHPFKRLVLHVDFQELVAGEKMTVRVPLVFVGVPEGVRVGGGLLEQHMHEITVEVDPSNMPNHIDVNVLDLPIGGIVHVSSLELPAGVEVLDDPDAAVCAVSAPKTSVATPAEGVEEISSEPELIRTTKDEEEAEAKEKK